MFEFFQQFFTKITSLVASVIISVGLFATPASQPVEIVPKPTKQIVATEEMQEITKGEGLKNEPKVANENFGAEISNNDQSPLLNNSKTKRPEKEKTYQLDSGATIDEYGNILNQAEFNKIQQQKQQEELLREQQRRNELLAQQNELLKEQIRRKETLEQTQINTVLEPTKEKVPQPPAAENIKNPKFTISPWVEDWASNYPGFYARIMFEFEKGPENDGLDRLEYGVGVNCYEVIDGQRDETSIAWRTNRETRPIYLYPSDAGEYRIPALKGGHTYSCDVFLQEWHVDPKYHYPPDGRTVKDLKDTNAVVSFTAK